MFKLIGWYFIGLVISVLFLRDAIMFINRIVFDVTPVSLRVNDSFMLAVRIFSAYVFGTAYIFFKIQKFKISLATGEIIVSMIGLILLFLVLDLIEVFLIVKILSVEKIFLRSILPLWLTFPGAIIYYAILLKYGFKRVEIKWF